MRQQGILLFACMLCMAFFFSSCKSELKDFSISYSFESVDNYKAMITVCSDKKYRIEKYNYFMDNHEGKRRPVIIEGLLTDEECKNIQAAIQDADMFDKEDTYGFDKETDADGGNIIYQITLDADKKQKYITYRNNEHVQLPSSLVQLTGQLNALIKTYEQKTAGK